MSDDTNSKLHQSLIAKQRIKTKEAADFVGDTVIHRGKIRTVVSAFPTMDEANGALISTLNSGLGERPLVVVRKDAAGRIASFALTLPA